jgi:glycosyltransferase involved in cell wall biosynthesis
MSLRRVLYLDTAFENEPGGDKNRSRFLWQALRTSSVADFALLEPHTQKPRSRPAFDQFPPVVTLRSRPGSPWRSDSLLSFDNSQRQQFIQQLSTRTYDLVVARFHAPWELCQIAAAHPSKPGIALDLDMVSSRLVGLTWKQNPSFRNRWFLLERIKLQRLERQLLRQPWLVAFSNPVELSGLQEQHGPCPPPGRLIELPNVMPNSGPLPSPRREPSILFFGSMNSAANLDGFRFLMDQLLPRIDADLRTHGVKIHVAGKNPPPWFAERIQASGSDRVTLLGAVDSMEQTIAASRFVLLPLRVASGTRTRILEAAAQHRAVITTPIGAEGIDVGDAASVESTPGTLAQAVRHWLQNPAEADLMGRALGERCAARYSQERVARDFHRDVDSFLSARKEVVS